MHDLIAVELADLLATPGTGARFRRTLDLMGITTMQRLLCTSERELLGGALMGTRHTAALKRSLKVRGLQLGGVLPVGWWHDALHEQT